jgi:transcriptional regulator with XRE-family HTH domain
MATFGEQLAAVRQAGGLSQHALAKAAGVDASYVNRLERGERQAPGVDLIRQFGRALGLSPEQTDALVVAGGGLPAALERIGPLDPTILLLADVLADPSIPQQERDDVRRIVALLVRRWRPEAIAQWQ